MFNDENNQEDVTLENNVEVEETEATEEETEVEETETTVDWEAEAKKYKAILDRQKNKKTDTEKPTKSDNFGYDVKAYLKASGINASEFDFVRTELKQSGLKDVDSLLENEYFQSRLEKHRSLQKTQNASPTGKRSGGQPTDSVEYWLTQPFDSVPKDMRVKVVNAKLKNDQKRGQFYNS